MPMTIYLNTVKIIKKQQVVYGIITEMNLIILLLMMMTLLLLIIMQTLQHILSPLNTKASSIKGKTSNENRENNEDTSKKIQVLKKT